MSPRARRSQGVKRNGHLKTQPSSAEVPSPRFALGGSRAVSRGGARAVEPARGARGGARAQGARGLYVGRARALDHAHIRQADGTPYPGVREQVQGHLLVGPVLAALRAWDPVVGLVVGSYGPAPTRAAVRGYSTF